MNAEFSAISIRARVEKPAVLQLPEMTATDRNWVFFR